MLHSALSVFAQILGGQVEPPVEFAPLYDMLAALQTSCASSKTNGEASTLADQPGGKTKVFSKLKELVTKKSG